MSIYINAQFRVRDRRIVSIPELGREGNTINSRRPLSRPETMYKIKTRYITKGCGNHGIDQHGFFRNRSIQKTFLPILEAIHGAERTGRSLQLLSIGLMAASVT
jgi:hypothetical protein